MMPTLMGVSAAAVEWVTRFSFGSVVPPPRAAGHAFRSMDDARPKHALNREDSRFRREAEPAALNTHLGWAGWSPRRHGREGLLDVLEHGEGRLDAQGKEALAHLGRRRGGVPPRAAPGC